MPAETDPRFATTAEQIIANARAAKYFMYEARDTDDPLPKDSITVRAAVAGYEVFDDDGDREEDGFDFSCMGWYFALAGCDDVPEDGKPRATEADALAAAWAHYKTKQDPPGMLVSHKLKAPALEWWAAWVFLDGSGRCLRVAVGAEAEARAAAWAWHDRRYALAESLHNGTFCPDCHSQDAYVEPIDDKTTTQPWCTECDVEMGSLFDDDLWPLLLAATDEQVAEVERWLRDSTAERPEVLRG